MFVLNDGFRFTQPLQIACGQWSEFSSTGHRTGHWNIAVVSWIQLRNFIICPLYNDTNYVNIPDLLVICGEINQQIGYVFLLRNNTTKWKILPFTNYLFLFFAVVSNVDKGNRTVYYYFSDCENIFSKDIQF